MSILSNSDGHKGTCKECVNRKERLDYRKNLEKERERSRIYYKKNKVACDKRTYKNRQKCPKNLLKVIK